MSQLSDFASSSLIEGGEFLYDEPQLFTPEFSESLRSASESNFIRPQQPPPIPDTLERIGPGRTKSYVLYSDMSKDEFVAWWLLTDFGKKKRLHWDSRHQANCWKQFEQVAHGKTGKPGVICVKCNAVLDHPSNGHHGTSSMNKNIKGVNCQRSASKRPNIKQLMQHIGENQISQSTSWSQEAWEHQLLKFLTISRLPFQILEHPEFHNLIHLARHAPSRPEIPSAKAIRRRLQTNVEEQQRSILQKLPPGAKLSIALDCWTSPFRQAFMAITGYFIDQDWNYCEILLGFEPLHGTHSGINLSAVVLDLLQKYQITDKVLAITTDNASNNNTLMASIQDSVQSLELNNTTTIIRVPCIAHVIQLSLNELLGKVKARPENSNAETQWSEAREHSRVRCAQRNDISDTLNKVRQLAVFINASPQRRESFLSLQSTEPKLVPIQDVRTRWNSTFLMLRRAKRLQSTFDQYCETYARPSLSLDREEWRQIEYLLWITQPFFKFTTLLCKTKDASIHLVFTIYNKLFAHLEKSIVQLQKKRIPWKQMMRTALLAAKEKLSEYYSMTDDVHGDLFAIGAILSPQQKLQFFSSKDWDDPEINWRERYRRSLKGYLKPYQERQTARHPSNNQALGTAIPELEMICASDSSQSRASGEFDELTEYLESATILETPRLFWKKNQYQFPALASLPRDILSVPATGAGVERLFNSARDVCHYRRGSLKPSTIKDLMMFMFTSKFEFEDEQRTLINEYLSNGEIQMANEEKETHAQDDFDAISDTNEDDSPLTHEEPLAISTSPSERALGKRPMSITSELDNDSQEKAFQERDDSDEVDLPSMQQRISARVRKRSRLLDGYEIS